MARFVLKREFCVFLESKSLTEKVAHFKSPLLLCAGRCPPFMKNIVNRLKILFFIGFLIGCNSKKKETTNINKSVKQKTEIVKKLTGKEIVAKLDSLEFFNLTDQTELERAKNEMIKSKTDLNYFSGTMRGETLDFTDNRFYSVDCEELFEVGGLTEYLDKVKPTFEKMDLELEYSNEKSKQNENYCKHTIELNGKEYTAFNGIFSDYDWRISYANFISMLNDQLKIQDNENRFYPIKCDNGGEMVLLTNEQFQVVENNYPNDDDHPQKLKDWKRKNGL